LPGSYLLTVTNKVGTGQTYFTVNPWSKPDKKGAGDIPQPFLSIPCQHFSWLLLV
jgi:hypothetical protein